MRGFRNFVRQTYRHASNAFSQVRGFAQQVDRGTGKAARIYSQLAPIVAPLAREALCGNAAEAVHKHIQIAMSSYGNAPAKVQRADGMGRTLRNMIKKETLSRRKSFSTGSWTECQKAIHRFEISHPGNHEQLHQ